MSRLLLLAVFFFFGILLGQVLVGRISEVTTDQLNGYLYDYVTVVEKQSVNAKTVVSMASLYMRYPLLAFLMGFTSIGIFSLPLISAAFGLFFSFAVCCFVAAVGVDGVFLALAVLGLRCLVTLPCFFVLAVPSLRMSAVLASASFGRGRRGAPVAYDKTWWLRLICCGVVLLAGMCVDMVCSPWLLRWCFECFLV